jgi:hypothetical protein
MNNEPWLKCFLNFGAQNLTLQHQKEIECEGKPETLNPNVEKIGPKGSHFEGKHPKLIYIIAGL